MWSRQLTCSFWPPTPPTDRLIFPSHALPLDADPAGNAGVDGVVGISSGVSVASADSSSRPTQHVAQCGNAGG